MGRRFGGCGFAGRRDTWPLGCVYCLSPCVFRLLPSSPLAEPRFTPPIRSHRHATKLCGVPTTTRLDALASSPVPPYPLSPSSRLQSRLASAVLHACPVNACLPNDVLCFICLNHQSSSTSHTYIFPTPLPPSSSSQCLLLRYHHVPPATAQPTSVPEDPPQEGARGCTPQLHHRLRHPSPPPPPPTPSALSGAHIVQLPCTSTSTAERSGRARTQRGCQLLHCLSHHSLGRQQHPWGPPQWAPSTRHGAGGRRCTHSGWRWRHIHPGQRGQVGGGGELMASQPTPLLPVSWLSLESPPPLATV